MPAPIATPRDAGGRGRKSALALHDIEPRVGGERALIFDQYEAIGFGDDDDGCGEPNAGNAGQVRQFAGQFRLGSE